MIDILGLLAIIKLYSLHGLLLGKPGMTENDYIHCNPFRSFLFYERRVSVHEGDQEGEQQRCDCY
ncbi:hypothetical protein D3C79_978460 [compost metagenome]